MLKSPFHFTLCNCAFNIQPELLYSGANTNEKTQNLPSKQFESIHFLFTAETFQFQCKCDTMKFATETKFSRIAESIKWVCELTAVHCGFILMHCNSCASVWLCVHVTFHYLACLCRMQSNKMSGRLEWIPSMNEMQRNQSNRYPRQTTNWLH